MRQVALAVVVTLGISGCAPSALSMFNKDRYYESALGVTRKGEIYQSLELKTLVTATDLSVVDPKIYGGLPTYFVGVYLPGDHDEESKWGLKNPDLSIVLNDGVLPTSIEAVDREHPLVKRLPAVNNWSHYYIVTFPVQATQEVRRNLTVEHKRAGMVVLSF